MNDVEADALLDTLDIWDRRHQGMREEQRCTPEPFGDARCVDDLTVLDVARRLWP